ncbi:MAG TPA: hypothetical protein VFP46_01945 [Candidatus Paceibacterota bacterium]|nr:hypothetical protein [Candidatus Paceibacterota bacterium]
MGFSLLTVQMTPVPSIPGVPAPALAVSMTAYNAVPGQTDDSPFTTASGAYSNPEIVAARSRDLADDLPFGTIIEITAPETDPNNTCGYDLVAPFIGYRVIEDTMHPKFTKRVDVLVPTSATVTLANGKKMNAANVLGICDEVNIRVVGHVDLSHLPKTQAELAALVNGKTSLAVK